MAYQLKKSTRLSGEEKLNAIGFNMTVYRENCDDEGRLEFPDFDNTEDVKAPREVEKYENRTKTYFYAEWRVGNKKFRVKSTSEKELESFLQKKQQLHAACAFWENNDGELVWDEYYTAWASTPTSKYAKKTVTVKTAEFAGATEPVLANQDDSVMFV